MNYEPDRRDTSFAPTTPAGDAMAEAPARKGLSRRAKIISWVVALAVIAGVLVLVTGIAGGAQDDARQNNRWGGPGGRPMTTVGVAAATAIDLPVTLEALGTVTPAATVTVRSQVSGVITRIHFREGQMVRRGQTLATIDARPYAAQLTQAQGAAVRDGAALDNARLTLQRFRTLLGQDSIARQDVDTQAALVRQLEGTAQANRGAVDAARLNVGFSEVKSPVDGRVGLRVTDVGNYIGAGDAAGVAVVTTLSPIDVQFNVPQDRIAPLQERIAADGELSAVALDRTRTTPLDRGTFLTLDNAVAVDSGTVRAKARFPNRDGALYPSQFVNVRLLVNTLRGAVTVPTAAVRQGAGGNFLWVLKADGTVEQRKVVTGISVSDRVQIVSGLKVGERVVTEGGDRIEAGEKVQTAQQAQAKADNPQPRGGERGQRGR